jgi:hypothetical protein
MHRRHRPRRDRDRAEGESPADWERKACRHHRAPSLYQQLGGYEPVAAAVDCFYRRILADEDLASFFASLDGVALSRPLPNSVVWSRMFTPWLTWKTDGGSKCL